MRTTIIALACIAAAPLAHAQKPGYGPSALLPGDNAAICNNVLMTYPADHLLLLVRGTAIHIDCGNVPSQSPVHIIFNDMAGLNFYRTHAGHRDVIGGEGVDD